MNATTSRLVGRPSKWTTRSHGVAPLSTTFAAPDSPVWRAAFSPGDWFAMSQMHEEYWLEARPILEEMERLRRLYGKVEARDGGHVLVCPPHVEWSLRNYEQSLQHIHRRIFHGFGNTGDSATGGSCAGKEPGLEKQTTHPGQGTFEDYECNQRAA